MNELMAEILTCLNGETLIFEICPKIITAFKDKKITEDDFRILGESYYVKGKDDFKLEEENIHNKLLCYEFSESLYRLRSCVVCK